MMNAVDVLRDPGTVGKMLLASVAVSAACMILFPAVFLIMGELRALWGRHGRTISYIVGGLFVLRMVVGPR